VRLSALIPHFVGFRLRQLVVEDNQVTLVVVPTRWTASCPICQHKSARIQREVDFSR